MKGRTVLLFCGTLASVLWVRAAGATEVLWQGPDSCPKDTFVREIEKNTEQTLENLPTPRITVNVEQRHGGWKLIFAVENGQENGAATRAITGDSCDDVSRAAAVAFAMALFEQQNQSRNDPPSDPIPGTPDRPPGQVTLETAEGGKKSRDSTRSRQTKPRKSNPLRFPTTLGATLDTALLGSPAFGGTLGFGVGVFRWDFGLKATAFIPTVVSAGDDKGTRFEGYLGELFACFVVFPGPARPRICLGYEAGAVAGRGTGPDLVVVRRQVAFWQALHPSLTVSVPISTRLAVGVDGGVAIGLSRATFVYDEGQVAHELPRVSGRASLLGTWTFD